MLNFKHAIKKLSFVGLLVFFIGGCATKTTYPQWFSQRTVDTKGLIIGVVEGKGKAEAKNNALKNFNGPLISESGIKTKEELLDINFKTKIKTFLIGESLLKNIDNNSIFSIL